LRGHWQTKESGKDRSVRDLFLFLFQEPKEVLLTWLVSVAGSSIPARITRTHIVHLLTQLAHEAGQTQTREGVLGRVIPTNAAVQARRAHTRTDPQVALRTRVADRATTIEACYQVIALGTIATRA